MCYNGGMNTIFGIVLFTVGTLGAFVAATAAIAYLRTMSVYMNMKKLYRISFSAGMMVIAALLSVLIARMLMPSEIVEAVSDMSVAITDIDSEKIAKKAIADSTEEIDKKIAREAVKNASVLQASGLNFNAWTSTYKGKEYAYVEIENSVPYVYAPDARGSFWYDINNIAAGRESGNITVIANAGIFNDNTSPRGTLVQNGKVILAGENSKLENTLVIDDAGNVGYTNKAIENGTVEYTDALTGKKVSGRKIVSAVTAFSPIAINGKAATKYKNRVVNYSAYRARSIFCVRDKGSYILITNKGEGIDGGGWNFDDMAAVALRHECQFAFNLDGGGSTALAWRTSLDAGFTPYATTERYAPTFIVFTADNLAPAGK